MTIQTLFRDGRSFVLGEVEVHLQPGLPQLHIVGLPDTSMRECGIKLKSAFRACGLSWPSGHQIVANLRPSYLRKQSSGVDLAIALAVMAQTDQLSAALAEALRQCVVYGEVALDGRVFATRDVGRALYSLGGRPLLTGNVQNEVRDGEWFELTDLSSTEVRHFIRQFDWQSFWQRPQLPDLEIHEEAARALALAVHLDLSVLVAGPQGSGKTTWARALYALTRVPDPVATQELCDLFGDEALRSRWRPFEQPHHTITAPAMVGCGVPLQPGVISRAHGGVLVMDEFLEFQPAVLEALREPIESGFVELARRGERARLPAHFQLVATTNLCPCGRLNPAQPSQHKCTLSLGRCRSVCARLSGPVLDRFDLLLFSFEWLNRKAPRVRLRDVARTLERLESFAQHRGGPSFPERLPDHLDSLDLSHRRRRAMLRVARGMADLEGSPVVRERHFDQASHLVTSQIQQLQTFFG